MGIVDIDAERAGRRHALGGGGAGKLALVKVSSTAWLICWSKSWAAILRLFLRMSRRFLASLVPRLLRVRRMLVVGTSRGRDDGLAIDNGGGVARAEKRLPWSALSGCLRLENSRSPGHLLKNWRGWHILRSSTSSEEPCERLPDRIVEPRGPASEFWVCCRLLRLCGGVRS